MAVSQVLYLWVRMRKEDFGSSPLVPLALASCRNMHMRAELRFLARLRHSS